MSMNKALIAELKHEAANTRKMLERVPVEHFGWRPHEKSMTLQRIASHLAEIPTWVNMGVEQDELNFATFERKPFTPTSAQDIVDLFDKNLAAAVTALEGASDETLNSTWTMRNGDHVIYAIPKVAVVRNFTLNHSVHHRGQLSVYLRLLDVAVPGMYGPSADEK